MTASEPASGCTVKKRSAALPPPPPVFEPPPPPVPALQTPVAVSQVWPAPQMMLAHLFAGGLQPTASAKDAASAASLRSFDIRKTPESGKGAGLNTVRVN